MIGIACGFRHTTPAPYDRNTSLEHTVREQYVNAVIQAGGVPILLPAVEDVKSLDRIESAIDGLLLPGGDDISPVHYGQEPHPALGDLSPECDESQLHITRRILAQDRPKPVLAICRGAQLLNVAAGGTLFQDIPSQIQNPIQHRQVSHTSVALHTIHIKTGSILHTVFGSELIQSNSYHHQAIDRIANGFVLSAESSDGVIEAIEMPGAPFVLGIQCHPEALCEVDPIYQTLFGEFVMATISHKS